MADAIKNLSDDNTYVLLVEHDLSILDYISMFYGEEDCYGVSTENIPTGDGINMYLDGYLPTDNIRFREYSLVYKETYVPDMLSDIIKHYNYESVEYNTSEETYSTFKLNVNEGSFNSLEIIVLLGENGTGKTTFIRLLAGLIPNINIINKKLSVSYKPQRITPKYKVTVKQLLTDKIHSQLINSQFNTEVLKPLNIPMLYDSLVENLSGG
jgi:ATP-binding cassette subfamily E protein 1